ncbi:MAG: para-nitrobenzyl esterase [Saprospiraceae bacterium]|jgi:para-nitrobenzyl esterase
MKKISFWILGCCLLCSCNMNDQKVWAPGQASIENGIIEGRYDSETGLQYFFGIPFAKPPVGELRWKTPQPFDNWEGIKETKTFGNAAMQVKMWDDLSPRAAEKSEDCLYLNVWTPAVEATKGLPVLVYFYGGGFVAGDGSEARYDGASMALKGIVTVTVNYRLSLFGFFAHPELSAESPYKASGNYGLLDQNAALKWVQKNIAAFGGDPKKVTIAGESAGSISVSAQMASPLSKNLIAGAIGESGAAINPTLYPRLLAEAEKIGQEFAKKIGHPSLAELRAMSTDEIFKAYNDAEGSRFPTVVDGYFYPNTLPEIFNASEQAQIPLLLGWNTAEIPGGAFMQGLAYTEENYIQKMKETFPDNYEEALRLYPHGSVDEMALSATALASDRFIAYSTWKWFDLHRKNSAQPVYRYLYSKWRPYLKSVADTLSSEAPKTPPAIGAPHACEIEYCMGNLNLLKDYWAWTPEDYQVSETMQDYFANFIKTGNPNGEGLSDWPSANATDPTPPVMIIDVISKTAKALQDDRYVFLDKIYKN